MGRPIAVYQNGFSVDPEVIGWGGGLPDETRRFPDVERLFRKDQHALRFDGLAFIFSRFLGMFIDKKAGTSFWVVILFFVGALAGFRNIYIFAKKIFDDKSGDDRRGRRNR